VRTVDGNDDAHVLGRALAGFDPAVCSGRDSRRKVVVAGRAADEEAPQAAQQASCRNHSATYGSYCCTAHDLPWMHHACLA